MFIPLFRTTDTQGGVLSLEEIVERSLLYDFYGSLLTEHQSRIYRMAVFHDLSLSEIAEAAGISRQAASDLLRRVDRQLQGYENNLHLVKKFNEAVHAGKAKDLDPPYLYETPHALETGPYYMIPAAGGMASTFGGPKINPNAQVVNFENEPIAGLYAAGAAAGGVWYQDDIGGNQLGGGMVFGRVAARHAAKRAKSRAGKKAR